MNNRIKNIYCISGLGADHRIFQYLELPENFTLIHIPWIKPEKNESIESYASRMSEEIEDDDPIILGVSFGGMIAVEISKQRHVRNVILISSIKSKKEKPLYFKIASFLRLNRIIPMKPYKFLNSIENYNIGAKTPEEKALATEYRKNLDLEYSDWAIDRILHWQNIKYPDNILHIHGSNDHLLPLRYVNPTRVIKGGEHLMIMGKAKEISGILHDALIKDLSL